MPTFDELLASFLELCRDVEHLPGEHDQADHAGNGGGRSNKSADVEKSIKTKDEFKRAFMRSAQTEQGDSLDKISSERMKVIADVNDDGTVTVYRGVKDSIDELQNGDFVTTSEEYAKKYGPKVIKDRIPVKKLRYMQGSKMGDPNSLAPFTSPTELIFVKEKTNFHKKYKSWEWEKFAKDHGLQP